MCSSDLVETHEINQSLTLIGKLKAAESVVVASEVAGKVNQIAVKVTGFVSDFATNVKQQGFNDLLIADMSMPRGGNFTQGHSSHQIGLDVDIWFQQASRPLTKTEREQPQPLKFVDKKKFLLDNKLWTNAQTQMLRVAAEDKRVARIFVSPVIKQHLCNLELTNDAWLNKVQIGRAHV